MKKYFVITFLTLALACHNVKNTAIPAGVIRESILPSIQPLFEKLSEEDRKLMTKYIERRTVTNSRFEYLRAKEANAGAAAGTMIGGMLGAVTLGGAGAVMGTSVGGALGGGPVEIPSALKYQIDKGQIGIPEGMTIGKAIADQKKYEKEQQQKAQDEEVFKAKQEAEINAMRESVTVKILSKKLVSKGGDEFTEMEFAYQNNTKKDITGFKGTFRIVDQFGKDITSLDIRFDLQKNALMKPGETIKVSRMYNGRDLLKFASTEIFKEIWEPEMIVFADGSKLDKDIRQETNLDAENEAHQAITIKLLSKKLLPRKGHSFTQDIEMELSCQNNTGKDITGFKGTLYIVDQFGQLEDRLAYLELYNEQRIKAGEVIKLTRTNGIITMSGLAHQSNIGTRRLAAADLGTLRFKEIFKPKIIVFADGSQLTATQK